MNRSTHITVKPASWTHGTPSQPASWRVKHTVGLYSGRLNSQANGDGFLVFRTEAAARYAAEHLERAFALDADAAVEQQPA